MTNHYRNGEADLTAETDYNYILEVLVPEWVEHFAVKSQDYKSGALPEPHKYLGEKGQFADIWRKIPKLYRAMWEDRPLVGEGKREILKDLIGHCFLALAMIDEKEARERPASPAGSPNS